MCLNLAPHNIFFLFFLLSSPVSPPLCLPVLVCLCVWRCGTGPAHLRQYRSPCSLASQIVLHASVVTTLYTAHFVTCVFPCFLSCLSVYLFWCCCLPHLHPSPVSVIILSPRPLTWSLTLFLPLRTIIKNIQ